MEILKDVDYIYLHWINGNFLSLKNIKQLALLNKPIIIFMHDMWTITGGCHYSFDCEKYKSKCNSCQMFTKPDKNDLSAKLFEKKLKLYNAFSNLYFVSPSKWLYNCAKKSTLTKDKPIFHIPNIIDPTIYKPFNKEVAREILNIEKDSTVLCFGASSVKSPYKGWDYLVGALKKLKAELQDRKIEVLIFGHGNYKEFKNSIPYKVNFIGPLRDDYSTLLLYNASDLFIIPSLADNLPTTVMESLCCGTPVVGFNTGGIPDMIEHKKNGYLCEYKNIDDIIKGIIFCLNNSTIGYNLPEFEEKSLIKRHLEMLQYIKNKN
jgi:glycosyltransferase involved in cell wall biosynthesis